MRTGSSPGRVAGAVWAAGCFAGALTIALTSPPADARKHQLTVQARLALLDLGMLAGLRDARGNPAVANPIAVMVVQDGGPTWVRGAVEAAASRDAVWSPSPSSPHLLRVAVVEGEATMALGFSLYRQGWNLARPQPVRLHHAPASSVVAAAVGTAVARRWRAPAWGLALAGGAAQGFAALASWPEPPGAGEGSTAWSEGPLGLVVRALARHLTDGAEAVLVGLIVLCLVLVAFDHRRSRRRGGRLLVAGLVGALGAAAWFEASLRTGWLGFAVTPPGIATAMLVIVGAWLGGRPPREGPS